MNGLVVGPVPSVLWHCWLGGRKGIRPVKNWVVGCWCGYLSAAICRLAYGPADATALTVCCFSNIQIIFTFLVPSDLGSPGKGPLNVCVCGGRSSVGGPPLNSALVRPSVCLSHSPAAAACGGFAAVGPAGRRYRLLHGQRRSSTGQQHGAQQQMRAHTRLTGIPGWAGTREVKPIWILLKQETVSGSGISWAICKSAPRSRQITMPAPHHSITGRMPFLPPNQQRQSTEGTVIFDKCQHQRTDYRCKAKKQKNDD